MQPNVSSLTRSWLATRSRRSIGQITRIQTSSTALKYGELVQEPVAPRLVEVQLLVGYEFDGCWNSVDI